MVFGRFMMTDFNIWLRLLLHDLVGLSGRRDVSFVRVLSSSAAEAALADAYCFAGGPVPDRELVLGRVLHVLGRQAWWS